MAETKPKHCRTRTTATSGPHSKGSPRSASFACPAEGGLLHLMLEALAYQTSVVDMDCGGFLGCHGNATMVSNTVAYYYYYYATPTRCVQTTVPTRMPIPARYTNKSGVFESHINYFSVNKKHRRLCVLHAYTISIMCFSIADLMCLAQVNRYSEHFSL